MSIGHNADLNSYCHILAHNNKALFMFKYIFSIEKKKKQKKGRKLE